MKITSRFLILLLTAVLLAPLESAFSNDIKVTNPTLGTLSGGSTSVSFNVTWKNSWRGGGPWNHWDAAWVFVKFRKSGGNWAHASLNETGHTMPAGATSINGYADSSSAFNISTNPARGVFIYRSADGAGDFTANGVSLSWNYSQDGVANSDTVEIQVFAVEMVLIPTGSFVAGDNATSTGSFKQGSSDSDPWYIGSEGAITTGNQAGTGTGVGETNSEYYYVTDSSGDDAASGSTFTIPANFPKGYQAFYMMKGEISQGQWVAFFNTLTATQKSTRDITGAAGKNSDNLVGRNNVSWSGSGDATLPNQGSGATYEAGAMNLLSWADVAAYLDWAGLRPLSELEYERAARGPYRAASGEYAWGTSGSLTQASSISNAGQTNEADRSGGVGDIKYSGGAGAGKDTAPPSYGSYGYGGGSSAGTGAAGVSATGNAGATAPTGGGNGGNGENGSAAAAGSAPGGGGGGGTSGGSDGAAGAAGRIVLTWSGGSATYDTTGTWTAPGGVTSVTVDCWGGGGGGGGSDRYSGSGGGGGGGAYSKRNSVTVSPGSSYTVTVGSGGTRGPGDTSFISGGAPDPGGNGGDSWFSSTDTVFCRGGAGGTAGYKDEDGPGGVGGQGPSPNCVYGGVVGAMRVGAMSYQHSTRIDSGAGYYGNMDLSGNLTERFVTVGNSDGRGFDQSKHGNGALDTSGNSDVSSWPGTNSSGAGFRGGSWLSSSTLIRVSDRTSAAKIDTTRSGEYGGRGGRSQPGPSCPTPTMLTATGAMQGVDFSWSAAPNATSYKLRYGNASGVYTTTVDPATSPASTGFVNSGTTIYGVVDAIGPGGTCTSNEASATAICFPAGTKVLMDDGSVKAIELLVAGDTIRSFNEQGEITTSTVETTMIRESEGYLEVTTTGGVIKATSTHPFFIGTDLHNADDSQFKPLSQFKVGDSLVMVKGNELERVEITEIKPIADKTTVYNLHVGSGPHTFFAESFAVHNK